MASEASIHKPFVFLAVDVRQAAGDMIEAIGALGVLRHVEGKEALTYMEMSNLRKAHDKIARALRNYDAVIAAKVEMLTRDQFEDAAEAA